MSGRDRYALQRELDHLRCSAGKAFACGMADPSFLLWHRAAVDVLNSAFGDDSEQYLRYVALMQPLFASRYRDEAIIGPLMGQYLPAVRAHLESCRVALFPAPADKRVWINDGTHDRDVADFVREDDDFVNQITSAAVSELRQTTRLRHTSFASAVEDGTADTLTAGAEALYLHLKNDYHLVYEYERHFDERTGEQVVRLPCLVREENRGTCIDLAVLFLSCLANAKLNPVYVQLAQGGGDHALAACWLKRPSEVRDLFLPDEQLRYLVEKDLLLLDATGFVEGVPHRQHKLNFREARDLGLELLRGGRVRFALDLRKAWAPGG